MKSLTIRVSDEEHSLMQAAARKRFMTITGIVRAHFHALCEADGAAAGADKAGAQPASTGAQPTAVATRRYGSMLDDLLLPDGTIDSRRLVSRMRTKANAGLSRKQFSDEYGISLADMELACNEVAKMGGHATIGGWHNSARVNELTAARGASIRYDKTEPTTGATPGKPVPMDDLFDEPPVSPRPNGMDENGECIPEGVDPESL